MKVPYLDIFFIVVFVVLTIRVIVRGFIKEFLDMAAVIVAVAGAVFLSGFLTLGLDKLFGKNGWNPFISFLVCFLIIYVIIKLLEGALHDLFEKLKLEKLDKALGFFLGLVEGFLVVSVILLVLNWLKGIKFLNIASFLNSSLIARFLLPIVIPFAHSLGGQTSIIKKVIDTLSPYV
jgi:membrane protein required for colicin V production